MSLGKDPITNKYMQKARRFTGTYSEAQQALRSFADEIASRKAPSMSPTKEYTFNEYMELFMAQRESSGKVAPGTIKRERDKLNSIGFIIGGIKIKDVTAQVLSDAYTSLRQGKSKSGKRLSGTYVSDINKKVSLMMKHALKHGYISSNPCAEAEVSVIDTKEKRSLPSSSVQKLLGNLNPSEPMECGVMLATMLGLRRGEVVGLSWGDIDFETKTIHIRHSYDDAGNLNKPKTKVGNRILPLAGNLLECLKKRHDIQMVLCESYAPDMLLVNDNNEIIGLSPDLPVICDSLGNRIHPAGLGQWWYKHRAGYGLDGWTLHELRHTFLTIAAEKGVHPSVMQKLAGHSTSRLTMDIYTHVNMDAQREAMNSLQDVFGGIA